MYAAEVVVWVDVVLATWCVSGVVEVGAVRDRAVVLRC